MPHHIHIMVKWCSSDPVREEQQPCSSLPSNSLNFSEESERGERTTTNQERKPIKGIVMGEKKTLAQLKKEKKPPEMKPNGSHAYDSFIYVPRNEAYFDWYYSQRQGKENQ